MSPRSLIPLALALALAACGTETGGGKQQVVTSFYPLQFVAAQVGGDAVQVTNLVKPGVEPHDFDPGPSQVAAVADADLVLYLKGFQPAVDDSVEGYAPDTSLDVGRVQALHDNFTPLEDGEAKPSEKGRDPHVWLDPTRLAAIGDAVGARLAKQDESHADGYRARAAELRTRLEELDSEFRTGLATCQRRSFIVSHNAFGYLAERYRLTQRPILGLSPDLEPSAGRLSELASYAKANGVTVIFFERLVSDDTARTLADEVGVRTDVLDPLEGLEPGSSGDYFAVMRTNLAKLRTALECA